MSEPELEAMQVILDVLEPLDRPARKRVLFWAKHKLIPPVLFDLTGGPDI